MATVSIRRQGTSIAYDPPSVKLGVNDFVVFANFDPEQSHQPAPLGEDADYWFDDELPPFEEGEPAATSPAINLAGPNPITYEDGLNPGSGITGTITF